jgi:histidyl-tRNA synthetase
MNKPKGTQDILPAESRSWQFVSMAFRETCERFGFAEIRTPTFESTELFARGVGETTDIVGKQMYTFSDLSGRSLTLKPEETAGVIRAVIENKLYAGTMPLKLYYETPCFRYENPQAGRFHEFHQFGIEILGSADMLADAVVIKLADVFFKRLELDALDLKINSIGCPKCRPKYREALISYFNDKKGELCETCNGRLEKNPMRIFDCKSEICQGVAKDAPVILDYLCEECAADFDALKKNLDVLEVSYEVDPRIVRGLDYYTKTAFEFVSRKVVAKATVCGGGRYDGLMAELGGPEVSGIGFGLGIERLLAELDFDALFAGEKKDERTLIIGMGEAGEEEALKLFGKMQAAGKTAFLDEKKRSLKKQLKYADKLGLEKAIIIGDDELAKGAVTVRDLRTGEQVSEPL